MMETYNKFGDLSVLRMNTKKTYLAFPAGLPEESVIKEHMEMGFEWSCISTDYSNLGFQLKNGSFKESAKMMLDKRTAKMNLVASDSPRHTTPATPPSPAGPGCW